MNVFISHSWQNKYAANLAMERLRKSGFTVWMDYAQLLPGQPIQAAIDQSLAKTDVVVLIWSKEAAASEGVQAELQTSFGLNKVVVPVVLDDTPMPRRPDGQQIKEIRFNGELQEGLNYLEMVLTSYLSLSIDQFSGAQAITRMNELLGLFEVSVYVRERKKSGSPLSEEEKTYWINEILEKEKTTRQDLEGVQDESGAVLAFLNERMPTLEKDLYNENLCGRLLQEARSFRYADHPLIQKFIRMLGTPAAPDSQSVIRRYESQLTEELERSRDKVKEHLGRMMPELLFRPLYNSVRYFYESSARTLHELSDAAARPGSDPRLASAVEAVCTHISQHTPPPGRDRWGILSYTSVVWVVHRVAYGLYQKGIRDLTAWNADWKRIQQVGLLIFAVVGAERLSKSDRVADAVISGADAAGNADALQQLARQRSQLERVRILQLQNELNAATSAGLNNWS